MHVVREWDSEFFGRPIYDVCWSSALRRDGITSCPPDHALVTTKVAAADYQRVDFLSNHGFVLCETELDFITRVSGPSDPDISLPWAQRSDIAGIQGAAQGLFAQSRFRSPWFADEQREALYAHWLAQAVLGRFDDGCLIQKDAAGDIAGFVTVKTKLPTARIGLLGVRACNQGQGVGRRLLSLAYHAAQAAGATSLSVATQGSNLAAANLYIRNGYVLASTSHWFYR